MHPLAPGLLLPVFALQPPPTQTGTMVSALSSQVGRPMIVGRTQTNAQRSPSRISATERPMWYPGASSPKHLDGSMSKPEPT